MPVDLIRLLFSFRGRIARSAFWCAGLLLALLFVLLLVSLEQAFGRNASLPIYPPVLWMMAALWVKRLRDRGRSPAWLLLLALPVLGPLLLGIELGLRRGTVGQNQYGPDPRRARGDYLTVA